MTDAPAGVTDAEAGLARPPASATAGWTVGSRRGWAIAAAVAVAWSLVASGVGTRAVTNPAGWPQLRSFFAAAAHPELDPAFLRLTAEASVTTVAYAVLGTLVAAAFGLVGGVLLSETWWGRGVSARPRLRAGWYVGRGLLGVPRGIHEAVWGLLLVSVLGRDPLAAILAIGIPFGAVSAKVVAEIVDDAVGPTYVTLRASGAGRLVAMAYGVLPDIAGDLVSYGFYRFECAIRAAAILGVIGAGGLGFQLALSFQALRYGEMWTLLYALVAVSGLADLWSGRLRHRELALHEPTFRRSLLLGAVLVVGATLALHVDPTSVLEPGVRDRVLRRLADAWPPSLGPGGWPALVRLSIETLQMSIIAIAVAALAGVPLAVFAARPRDRGRQRDRGVLAWGVRALLLFTRAVPPPVWAFLLLFVLLPGPLPGALALAIYNLGVLGRLMAESLEHLDPRPGRQLWGLGATRSQVFAYATLPQAAPRLVGYSLYRWEVVIRESVIVGLVGAGGLGRRLMQQVASFDDAGITTTLAALIVLTVLVDAVSAQAPRAVR